MVRRGGCSFATKAVNVALYGGRGMILVNTEPGRLRMAGEDVFRDVEAADQAVISVMVSPEDGQRVSVG